MDKPGAGPIGPGAGPPDPSAHRVAPLTQKGLCSQLIGMPG